MAIYLIHVKFNLQWLKLSWYKIPNKSLSSYRFQYSPVNAYCRLFQNSLL